MFFQMAHVVIVSATNCTTKAILLFVTFARLGSIIPTRPEIFKVGSHLSWGDVRFRRGGVRIKLRKTKTIQCNERVLTFSVPALSCRSVCLVENLRTWWEVTPRRLSTDPVFLVYERGDWVAMTRSKVDQCLKGALKLAGVSPENYGWSSFRRGAATTYWLATGDLETLRVQGDWQSLAYREYLSLPSTSRSGVAGVLLGGLS